MYMINFITSKYADDTSLLVPEINTVSLKDEFDHLHIWSQANKLVINIVKRLCLTDLTLEV